MGSQWDRSPPAALCLFGLVITDKQPSQLLLLEVCFCERKAKSSNNESFVLHSFKTLVIIGAADRRGYDTPSEGARLAQSNPRWCHEVRHRGGEPLARPSVFKQAKVKQERGELPPQPIGPHFIDIGVTVVVPNTPVVIIAESAAAASGAPKNGIVVEPKQLFPIVEGFFGPLRVPLPRTSAVLDAYYGREWRTNYAVKVFGQKSGVGKYVTLLDPHFRRAIHPAVPLKGCPTYLGCFRGAGCDASETDVVWRWL